MIQKHPTKISFDWPKIPKGAKNPLGQNLSNSKPAIEDLKLTITKSIVENENNAITFDNILNDDLVGIERQVNDILKLQFDDPKKLIHYNIDFKEIKTNISLQGDMYTNAAMYYIAIIDIYIIS